MKFTIGTVSNFQEYSEELLLIKSSLLYADEIELIGLTEYAVYKYLPYILDGNKNMEEIFDALAVFLNALNFPEKEDVLRDLNLIHTQLQELEPILKKKKRRSKAEIQAQFAIRKVEKTLKEELFNAMAQLCDQPSSQELKWLIDNNLVNVFDYGLNSFDMDAMAGSYIATMMNAIYAENAFPLFDNTSLDFIGSFANTKIIEINKVKAEVLRHAGVATRILMTLPTLEGASYDELIDLRKQNSGSLIRFRKAIYDYSAQISSMPWDNDFQYECIKLYDTQVAPQVEEINEILTETSTLKNLGKKVLADEEIRRKAGYMAGGMATAIATSSNLNDLLMKLLLAMSCALFSAEAATGFLKIINLRTQAKDEAKKEKDKAEKNVMYYYYLASKL